MLHIHTPQPPPCFLLLDGTAKQLQMLSPVDIMPSGGSFRIMCVLLLRCPYAQPSELSLSPCSSLARSLIILGISLETQRDIM